MVAVGAMAAFAWFFHSVSSPAGRLHVGARPPHPPARLRAGRPLLPRALPARPPVLARCVGGPHGRGGRAGHRPPLRPLRRGLGLLRPVGPDGDVDLGERGRPHLDRGAGGGAGGDSTAAAAGVFLVLPAPVVASRVGFLARAGLGGAVGVPGDLAGDAGSPGPALEGRQPRAAPPASAATWASPQSLDTALRGKLGNQLVMQVRADRPSYWVGETFDTWQGTSWTAIPSAHAGAARGLALRAPALGGRRPFGQPDLQTFYVTSSTADLVFHADSAEEVWFPSSSLFTSDADTIVSPIGLGSGSIYTVESNVSTPTPEQLRTDASAQTLPPADAGAVRAAAALVPPRPGAGPVRDGGGHVDLRQGGVAHRLDRCPHPLLHRHSAAAARRGHGRRVPLRQPGRLLRADLDVARGDAALARDPRPRGGGLRARRLRPDHRPLPGPRRRRPRLGPGVVPGLRLAELRSRPPSVPSVPPSPGATALRDVAGALRRIPFVPVAAVLLGAGLVVVLVHVAPVTAGDVGGAGGAPGRAGRPAGGSAAPSRRDPGRVRHRPGRAHRQRVDHLGPAGLVGARRAPTGASIPTRRPNAPWSPRPGERGCAPAAAAEPPSARRS